MSQDKIQITQHQMREEDKKFLLLDLKDQDAYQEIQQTKKRYSKQILITLILMKFSVYMTQYILNYYYNDPNNNDEHQNLRTLMVFIFGYFFCQIIIGFMSDMISVQASWIFTWFLSVLSILTAIFQINFLDYNFQLFQNILLACARSCIYIMGIHIIFDTSYELKSRFNFSALFIVVSSFVSQYISLGADIFADSYEDYMLYGLLYFCLLLSILCGITVIIVYRKIEKVKENSSAYQRFSRHRGMGLTMKAIRFYYSNYNMLFLVVVTFASSLFKNNDPNQLFNILQQKDDGIVRQPLFRNFFLSSSNLGNIFITYFMLSYINKSHQFIYNYYSNIKYTMIICFIVYIYAIIVISFSDYFSGNILSILFIGIQVYQGYVGIVVCLIANQINYCLQNEKSQIKCIGLSILGFFQDLPSLYYLIPTNTKNSVIISYSSQTGVILMCVIYIFQYLKNKNYNQLESQIEGQYFKSIPTETTLEERLSSEDDQQLINENPIIQQQ